MIIDFVASIITGVLASLVASFVWLYLFSRLRPHLEISSKIAKFIDTKGNTVYKIKVINKSRRTAVNIRAKLSLVTPTIAPSGQILTTTPIQLKTSELIGLPEFNINDKEARYAFRFLSYDDIASIWADDRSQYLSFTIYATDSLSGLGKYLRQNYYIKRNSIVEGDFVFGNSFDIQ